jgi:hypothetical protein
MKLPLVSAVLNTGLAGLAITLLGGPLILGQMLLTSQSGALGEMNSRQATVTATGSANATAAAEVVKKRFMVYPNVSEFTQYAEFGSPQLTDTTYQSAVTFTAFANQQASYNGLMALYNAGSEPMAVSVQVGKLSGPMLRSRIWLTLTHDGGQPASLLTQSAARGATALTVADLSGMVGQTAVVGTDVVSGNVDQGALNLRSPLVSKHEVGEKVYFGPAFYLNGAEPILDTTHTVTLQPQQRATLSLVVATDAGAEAQTKAVLPLTIVGQ